MIRHIVLFKFNSNVTEAERAAVVAGFKAMPAAIAEIRDLEAGLNVVASPRAYDLALIVTFANRQDLERYVTHPAHLPAAQRGIDACAHIVSVDYETMH
ncbi:MAG: Dabb family protein [Acidobacteria bacterium]|nr:Dabb family protein [Acidobacteriota bacterium]MBI3655595.1 Dabb family protein [Acidobacteriota bacterium]